MKLHQLGERHEESEFISYLTTYIIRSGHLLRT